jgi:hypothetical protein
MRPGAVARFALLFVAWFIVGLLVAFDALAFISALVIVLPVTGALTAGLMIGLDRRWPGGAARWAVAVGAAAMPLFIAYNNRHGPGTHCHTFSTPAGPGQECGDQWDPRPWVTIGAALVITGFVGALWSGYRGCRASHALGASS